MIEFNFGIEITLESNYDSREITTCRHRGHLKFISRRVGEEIRGFEGSLVRSAAREKRMRYFHHIRVDAIGHYSVDDPVECFLGRVDSFSLTVFQPFFLSYSPEFLTTR